MRSDPGSHPSTARVTPPLRFARTSPPTPPPLTLPLDPPRPPADAQGSSSSSGNSPSGSTRRASGLLSPGSRRRAARRLGSSRTSPPSPARPRARAAFSAARARGPPRKRPSGTPSRGCTGNSPPSACGETQRGEARAVEKTSRIRRARPRASPTRRRTREVAGSPSVRLSRARGGRSARRPGRTASAAPVGLPRGHRLATPAASGVRRASTIRGHTCSTTTRGGVSPEFGRGRHAGFERRTGAVPDRAGKSVGAMAVAVNPEPSGGDAFGGRFERSTRSTRVRPERGGGEANAPRSRRPPPRRPRRREGRRGGVPFSSFLLLPLAGAERGTRGRRDSERLGDRGAGRRGVAAATRTPGSGASRRREERGARKKTKRVRRARGREGDEIDESPRDEPVCLWSHSRLVNAPATTRGRGFAAAAWRAPRRLPRRRAHGEHRRRPPQPPRGVLRSAARHIPEFTEPPRRGGRGPATARGSHLVEEALQARHLEARPPHLAIRHLSNGDMTRRSRRSRAHGVAARSRRAVSTSARGGAVYSRKGRVPLRALPPPAPPRSPPLPCLPPRAGRPVGPELAFVDLAMRYNGSCAARARRSDRDKLDLDRAQIFESRSAGDPQPAYILVRTREQLFFVIRGTHSVRDTVTSLTAHPRPHRSARTAPRARATHPASSARAVVGATRRPRRRDGPPGYRLTIAGWPRAGTAVS